ncbi:MAG: ABC transporter permease [Deltaproteobacteria bacterium]|nr:ABC transporter permease [Deltaproteobacteria bacterium]
MLRYIFYRLLLTIPILLLVTFIVFSLASLSPVDPGRFKLGVEATEEEVAQYNKELGLDKPFLVRYVTFLYQAVQGDFGTSYYTERPVFHDIIVRWPNTIIITVLSVIIAMVIGIPLGVLSAVKQYSWMDKLFSTSAMFLASVPTFCMATIFLLVFSLKLHWVPASGIREGFICFILPSLTMGIHSSAFFLRYSRTTMLDTIRQDYIRTARSKGASEASVVWKHGFTNALLPLITIAALTMGYLLGGVVIMETIFVIPGLGLFVLEAIHRNDTPVIMGTIPMLSLTFMVILIAVDILYGVVNPMIKARFIVSQKRSRSEAK